MGLLDSMMGMGGMDAMPSQAGNNVVQQLRQLRYARPANALRPQHTGRATPNPLTYPSSGGDMDYSQFTYSSMANQQARDSGIEPLDDTQVNPFTIMPNKGFFANHPNLTRGLEGGIYGAAATQGAQTWGEGISNVAKGMIEGPMMRNQAWQRQFQAPFQRYDIMAHIKQQAQQGELTDSMIQYHRSMANKMDKDPIPHYYGNMAYDDGSVHAFETATGKDVMLAPPGSVSKPERAQPRGSDVRQAFVAANGEEPDDPKARAKWGKDFAQFQVNVATGKGVGTHAGNRDTDIDAGIAEPKEVGTARDLYTHDMEVLDSSTNREQVESDLFVRNKYKLPKKEDVDAEIQRQKDVRTAKWNNDYKIGMANPMPRGTAKRGTPQNPKIYDPKTRTVN